MDNSNITKEKESVIDCTLINELKAFDLKTCFSRSECLNAIFQVMDQKACTNEEFIRDYCQIFGINDIFKSLVRKLILNFPLKI